jgi:hypothetical protein
MRCVIIQTEHGENDNQVTIETGEPEKNWP